jgi:hypothetical protein
MPLWSRELTKLAGLVVAGAKAADDPGPRAGHVKELEDRRLIRLTSKRWALASTPTC